MFSPVAGTLTLRVPCDYIGYILKQCFRFEACFCLVVLNSKSTASSVRQGRNAGHRFWLFDVLQRCCFTSFFMITPQKNIIKWSLEARKQIYKNVYSYTTLQLWNGQSFSQITQITYFRFFLGGWFSFKKRKRRREKIKEFGQEHMRKRDYIFIEWSEFWSSVQAKSS